MRGDEKVLDLRMNEGARGYGVFIMLIEMLRDACNRQLLFNPKKLAYAINESDEDCITRVVKDYGLFTITPENYIKSDWLDTQLAEFDNKKEAAAAAGRRGAAKRWHRDVNADEENNSNPNSTPLGEPCNPNGNITNITEYNIINKTQSKLLNCSWKDYGGKELLEIARGNAESISLKTEEWTDVQQCTLDAKYGTNVYNLGAVLEVCKHFKVNCGVYKWLIEYTDCGKIGSPELVRLLQIYNDAKNTKFTPKYPAEYIMTKCLIRDDR